MINTIIRIKSLIIKSFDYCKSIFNVCKIDICLYLLLSLFLVKDFIIDYLPKYSYVKFRDNPTIITIIKDKEYLSDTIYYICNDQINNINDLNFSYSLIKLKEGKKGRICFDFSWDKNNLSVFSAFGEIEFERNNYFFSTQRYDYKNYTFQKRININSLNWRFFFD